MRGAGHVRGRGAAPRTATLMSALLLLLLLLALLLALARSPAPTLAATLSPSTTSPTSSTGLGTAFAPTMPPNGCNSTLSPLGTTCSCLNPHDYHIWTTSNSNGQNGYDRFDGEMKNCAQLCILAPQDLLPTCGTTFTPACPSSPLVECVADCLNQTQGVPGTSQWNGVVEYGYTKPCAQCMGQLESCALSYCTVDCVNALSPSCWQCAYEYSPTTAAPTAKSGAASLGSVAVVTAMVAAVAVCAA